MEESWTNENEDVLELIRKNSLRMSELHRKRYFHYAHSQKYFEIPIIVLSVFSGTFVVGSTPFLAQLYISLVGSFVSMVITILSSIKLYLNINSNMVNDLDVSRAFYVAAVDIFITLRLPRENRPHDGDAYLHDKQSEYIKLFQSTNLLVKKFRYDNLGPLDENIDDTGSVTSSTSRLTFSAPKRNTRHNLAVDSSFDPISPKLDNINHNPLSKIVIGEKQIPKTPIEPFFTTTPSRHSPRPSVDSPFTGEDNKSDEQVL